MVAQIRASIVEAARIDDGQISEPLCAYYCDRMARERMVQLDERPLFRQPLHPEKMPWLRAALDGLFAQTSIDAGALVGASSAAALWAERPTVADLYAPTLFAGGMPLVGAGSVEYGRLVEAANAVGAERAIDRTLGAALLHELCHGRARPALAPLTPWLVLEAAALHLGCAAAPTGVFPDEAGQALPGVAPLRPRR